MHEQHADMRLSRRNEFGVWPENRAVHVPVASGLEDELLADVVVVGFCESALFQEGSWEGREAFVDYAGGFAGCVHFDALNHFGVTWEGDGEIHVYFGN